MWDACDCANIEVMTYEVLDMLDGNVNCQQLLIKCAVPHLGRY